VCRSLESPLADNTSGEWYSGGSGGGDEGKLAVFDVGRTSGGTERV